MTCETIVIIDPSGFKHYKPKKVYNSLDEAIAVAKKMNARDQQITKLVAYKCDKCFKYHIGRNGKLLSKKEKHKIIKAMNF